MCVCACVECVIESLCHAQYNPCAYMSWICRTTEQKTEEPPAWSPDEALVRSKFNHYDVNNSGNLDENECMALAQVTMCPCLCLCVLVCVLSLWGWGGWTVSVAIVCGTSSSFALNVHACRVLVPGSLDGVPPQVETPRFRARQRAHQGAHEGENCSNRRAHTCARTQTRTHTAPLKWSLL